MTGKMQDHAAFRTVEIHNATAQKLEMNFLF